jgi:hypothetical protein
MPQCGPTDADAVGAQVASSGGEVDRVRVAVVGATEELDEVAKAFPLPAPRQYQSVLHARVQRVQKKENSN